MQRSLAVTTAILGVVTGLITTGMAADAERAVANRRPLARHP